MLWTFLFFLPSHALVCQGNALAWSGSRIAAPWLYVFRDRFWASWELFIPRWSAIELLGGRSAVWPVSFTVLFLDEIVRNWDVCGKNTEPKGTRTVSRLGSGQAFLFIELTAAPLQQFIGQSALAVPALSLISTCCIGRYRSTCFQLTPGLDVFASCSVVSNTKGKAVWKHLVWKHPTTVCLPMRHRSPGHSLYGSQEGTDLFLLSFVMPEQAIVGWSNASNFSKNW